MAKKSWLKDGDQNSKFYHAYLNAKNHKRVKTMCLSDGTVLESPSNIHQAAVDYFTQFLGAERNSLLPTLSDLISPVITPDENLDICKAPTLEEMKDALFSIPIESSPGPDDFGSGFFRFCWNIVKDDLLEAINDFFINSSLPRFYTASFIVLIPKMENPTGFDQFRPISLCSVTYKICAKIIVNRMTNFLVKMIS
ncbi:hypothetical protein I3842_16G020500 [Carya illinoinensis]|uniref:Reverse transcriptase domain-containing protein n=1 Tax=Carya illinoinensis TaxID=32201 RepID=A0A922A7Q9_CARIL|nr:hypothetical protein I3842_16G020500 [Carya illinoinensis]